MAPVRVFSLSRVVYSVRVARMRVGVGVRWRHVDVSAAVATSARRPVDPLSWVHRGGPVAVTLPRVVAPAGAAPDGVDDGSAAVGVVQRAAEAAPESRRVVTIDVGEAWGHLIRDGVYESAAPLLGCVRGGAFARARVRVRARPWGARVWWWGCRRLVGVRGAHALAVRAATGARVHVDWRGPPAAAGGAVSAGGASVRVYGSAAEVRAARAAMDALVTPAVTLDVEAEWGALVGPGRPYASADRLMSRLVGVRGATKIGIAAASGAGVFVAASGRPRVYLCGPPGAVAAARAAIEEALVPTAEVDVAALVAAGAHGTAEKICGRLVGSHGDAVRQLEARTGARVWPRADCRVIYLAGPPAAVAAARAWIEASAIPAVTLRLEEVWGNLIGPGCPYDSAVAVAEGLVGPGGAGVRCIAEATGGGVVVEMETGYVHLMGGPDAVARACEGVAAAIVPAAVLRVGEEWGHLIGSSAPYASAGALAGRLIGPDGATRAGLVRASGALAIRVYDGGCAVAVMGRASAVAAARAAMDRLLAPAATLVVADAFGPALAAGAFDSPEELVAWLVREGRATGEATAGGGGVGGGGTTAEASAVVRASADCSRVFLLHGHEGADADVSRAAARLAGALAHVTEIDAGARWAARRGGGGGNGGMHSRVGGGGEGGLATPAAGAFEGDPDVLEYVLRGAAGAARASGGARVAVHRPSRVVIAGTAASAAAAEAALAALMVPAATVDVAAEWGHLCGGGGGEGGGTPFAGPLELRAWIMGREYLETTGAGVWVSRDGATLYIMGAAEGAARARAAVDASLNPPPVVLHAAEAWGGLVRDGVFLSGAALTRAVAGPRGATARAIEAATGARVLVLPDGARVLLGGAPDAVARARAEMDHVLSPSVVVSVAEEFAGLLAAAGGPYADAGHVYAFLSEHDGRRLAAYSAGTGVRVCRVAGGAGDVRLAVRAGVAADGSLRPRGEVPGAVAAALRALRSRVTPRGVIDLAAFWARGSDFEDAGEVVGALLGAGCARPGGPVRALILCARVPECGRAGALGSRPSRPRRARP